MAIIQRANPNTKAIRSRRSTWIQKATFTQSQVVSLYQQVQWPAERKAVIRLREKLQFFLNIAALDVGLDTNAMVRDMKYEIQYPNVSTPSNSFPGHHSPLMQTCSRQIFA